MTNVPHDRASLLRTRRVPFIFWLQLLVLCNPAPATAQSAKGSATQSTQDPDKVAQALHEAGNLLYKVGRYAEACDLYLQSIAASPGRSIGATINLAKCKAARGDKAAAYNALQRAIADINRQDATPATSNDSREADRTRLSYLTVGLRAVEQQISFVQISVPYVHATRGIAVRLDGLLISPNDFELEQAVDVGPHSVTGTAPAKLDFVANLNVEHPKQRYTVVVLLKDPPEILAVRIAGYDRIIDSINDSDDVDRALIKGAEDARGPEYMECLVRTRGAIDLLRINTIEPREVFLLDGGARNPNYPVVDTQLPALQQRKAVLDNEWDDCAKAPRGACPRCVIAPPDPHAPLFGFLILLAFLWRRSGARGRHPGRG